MLLRSILPVDLSPVAPRASSHHTSSPIFSSEQGNVQGDACYKRSLYKNSSLLRLLPQYALSPGVQLNTWYRLPLKLVTEMGLPLEPSVADICSLELQCQLVCRRKQQGWVAVEGVDIRALTCDAWDMVSQESPWPGFDGSGYGGMDYRFTRCVADEFYLLIDACQPQSSSVRILSVTLGPFRLDTTSNNQSSSLVTHAAVSDAETRQQIHRALRIPGHQTYFMLQENWCHTTTGKLWDSALILASIFTQAMQKNPQLLANRRIIDLSAGTGYIGLLMAHLQDHYCQSLGNEAPPEIILTDIAEGLDHIRRNHRLNEFSSMRPKIEPLHWGDTKAAKKIVKERPVDIIIASDLLYNACDFVPLIRTLRDLSTPGITVIYLGYKRRGFGSTEEQQFFKLCQPYFDIRRCSNIPPAQHVDWERAQGCLLPQAYEPNNEESCTPFLGRQQRSSVQIYRLALITNAKN
ncbi:putative methyltransferase-domain-containing protein [Radiomyces spectabilis]|uniref:putative methyltransferase-domain-containing protein n=1 Tax=Radiomyces spectabilis TaxID=64574 RepID=UPI002220D5EE|nr:putative methyltransferase-domain-containing protein [Radiomyces spectabilis]KAI8374657.1 putative methyltransferase-domain-containing protein [Radiomyces spectabilis]